MAPGYDRIAAMATFATSPAASHGIMCLQFADDVLESPYLTTGQIENITNELGSRLFAQNVTRTVRKWGKFFTADAVRKQGVAVGYKLNVKGKEAYGKVLKGEKLR